MKILPLASFILLLFGCNTLPQERFTPGTSVIIPAEKAHLLMNQCTDFSLEHYEATWLPSDDQINELESRLPAIIEEALQLSGFAGEFSSADYYRQYGGFVVAGRKLIYVTGLHQVLMWDDSVWRNASYSVCDGGVYKFGATYDLRTKHFEFGFNFDGG